MPANPYFIRLGFRIVMPLLWDVEALNSQDATADAKRNRALAGTALSLVLNFVKFHNSRKNKSSEVRPFYIKFFATPQSTRSFRRIAYE